MVVVGRGGGWSWFVRGELNRDTDELPKDVLRCLTPSLPPVTQAVELAVRKEVDEAVEAAKKEHSTPASELIRCHPPPPPRACAFTLDLKEGGGGVGGEW